MKKLSITFLLISVLSACNSEKEQLFDELLSGTIWEHQQAYATPLPPIYDEAFYDGFSKMLELFPDIKYNIVTLKFEKGICFYEDECYQNITIEQYNLSYQKYIFEIGEYNNDYGTLKIKSNGIYLQKFGTEEKLYTLDNFQIDRYGGRRLLRKYDEKIYFWQNKIPLNYQRKESQVIFTNDSLKWIGIIDFSQYTMDITQIQPVKKFIHTFELQ